MPLKILIAEDDEDIAYQYAESLKSLGHGVFVTKDGEECLSAYRYGLMKSFDNRSPFDVVVVDYAMPKKNGVELAKAILAEQPKQKIIFVSAHGNLLLEDLEEFGSNVEFLSKPVSILALIAKIEGKRIKDVTRAVKYS